jgi:GTP-binding protein
LIGKPNAGKSTLLAAVSQATPKIADYPFTTLSPQLGIAELPSSTKAGYARRLTIADIPGLIEKASQGAGLGTRFLRHIERTRLLIHVLEPEPTDGSDPIENYHAIRNELSEHSQALAEKPEIIALSKMDLMGDASDHDAARELFEDKLGQPVLTFSSASKTGLNALLEAAWSRLKQTDAPRTGWESA